MKIDSTNLVIWPRDWLQEDIPRLQVFSIGYDVSLSQWLPARNLSLDEQAAECLDGLAAAGLGDRPICFITHSFGGIIAKRLLLQALDCDADSPEGRIGNAIRGFVFYGTPHRGSPITRALRPTVIGSAFRPSSAVAQLDPRNEALRGLDRDFQAVAAHREIDVVSVAEGKKTAIASVSGRAFQAWLVPDGSADAGVGRFVTLECSNHPELCKPPDRKDSRYTLILEFLNRIISAQSKSQTLRSEAGH
mmetsp:Transcript_38802/g.94932  ORF Transcript_38802/g.94932 Transcript_38802/m.94932 type:complete len:248 (-) Transcript_38802:20-763(-)